jgi:hypothetical protein
MVRRASGIGRSPSPATGTGSRAGSGLGIGGSDAWPICFAWGRSSRWVAAPPPGAALTAPTMAWPPECTWTCSTVTLCCPGGLSDGIRQGEAEHPLPTTIVRSPTLGSEMTSLAIILRPCFSVVHTQRAESRCVETDARYSTASNAEVVQRTATDWKNLAGNLRRTCRPNVRPASAAPQTASASVNSTMKIF